MHCFAGHSITNPSNYVCVTCQAFDLKCLCILKVLLLRNTHFPPIFDNHEIFKTLTFLSSYRILCAPNEPPLILMNFWQVAIAHSICFPKFCHTKSCIKLLSIECMAFCKICGTYFKLEYTTVSQIKIFFLTSFVIFIQRENKLV